MNSEKSDVWYSEYIQTVLNKELVYFPVEGESKGLLVFFSAMDAERKFNRINWFKDVVSRNGYSCLFLNDTNYQYYLGDDSFPSYHTYEKIIKHFAENEIDPHNIYTIGSSMGGYAAIYYAFIMKLKGAIVGVPQVNKRLARMHTHKNWIRSINSTESQWIDLDVFLNQPHLELPKLYIEYGNYPADKHAAELLIKVYQDRSGVLALRKVKGNEHSSFMSPKIIRSSIDYFNNEDFNE